MVILSIQELSLDSIERKGFQLTRSSGILKSTPQSRSASFLMEHFGDAWLPAQYEEFFQSKGAYADSVEMNNKCVGAIIGRKLEHEKVFELLQIAVHPSYRSQKIGSQLMSQIPTDYSIFLEVRSSNFRAINFYDRFGMKKLNTIDQFYRDGESALRLCKLASGRNF